MKTLNKLGNEEKSPYIFTELEPRPNIQNHNKVWFAKPELEPKPEFYCILRNRPEPDPKFHFFWESMWGSDSFYKNRNWRFSVKGKNRPTLAYFLCIPTFWHHHHTTFTLFLNNFFTKSPLRKEEGVRLLCPTLAWHTWRRAPSFSPRPRARCNLHLYPYLIQHTLRSAPSFSPRMQGQKMPVYAFSESESVPI